jgi:hypothetical protein
VHRSEYHRLNERFYKMSPYTYLDMRLKSLVLMASGSEKLDDLLAEGVSYQDLTLSEPEPANQLELDKYAALESTVLLHHACEAMLRLYLAHEYRTECPWLKLAATTSPRDFKSQVRKLGTELTSRDRIADMLEAFSYTADWTKFDGATEDVWLSHEAALVQLVDYAIREVLNNANVYNAAKHGLAVQPGEVSFSLGGRPGHKPLIRQDGPALNHLEMSGNADDRHWQLRTTWVNPLSNLARVHLMTLQIRNLFEAGRSQRKLGQPERFEPLKKKEVEAVLTHGQKPGYNLTSYDEPLRDSREGA